MTILHGDAAGRMPGYALGHSGRELERLALQDRIVGPLTRRFLEDAGLAPGMRVLDVGSGAAAAADWLRMIAELVRTLLPEMARLSVATPAEVDIETLAERLRREAAEGGGVVVGRSEIGAWARI
jgi:hypothetical protein